MTYVETVFKSLACFNASFLLANEEHYCCTSRHHGINMEQAEKTFDIIGKLEVESIKDLVSFIVDFLTHFRVTHKSSLRFFERFRMMCEVHNNKFIKLSNPIDLWEWVF